MRTNIYKEKITALLRKKHLLSIADIHTHISEADYSTIFRNVEQLAKSGEIKQVIINGKTVMYENGECSHDHFVCTDCGMIDVINRVKTTIPQAFKIHDVTVRGQCIDCNK